MVLDGRNHVLIRNGAPFSGLSQMTLSFAWRGEGKGGDAGLVWLEGSFGVMLKGRGLEVMLVTRNGKTHRIDAEYPSALNGAWHDFELVYDGNTGEATLAVDGRPLARRNDLAGGLAIGREGGGTIGTTTERRVFSGAIDSLRIFNTVRPPS